MPTIEEMIATLKGARAVLAPVVEGFFDLSRVNLEASTAAAVDSIIPIQVKRLGMLNDAIAALERLQGDGYPKPSTFEIDPLAYADLLANLATIQAAISVVRAGTLAESLVLEGVEVRPRVLEG